MKIKYPKNDAPYILTSDGIALRIYGIYRRNGLHFITAFHQFDLQRSIQLPVSKEEYEKIYHHMTLDDGHRPESMKEVCNVRGTITVPKDMWESFRRAIMPEEDTFNPMGATIDQLMGTIKGLIPDDDHSYKVSYTNNPNDHFIAASVVKLMPDGSEPIVVANINIGHLVLQSTAGAFDLGEMWTSETIYPPGEVDA